MSDKQTTSKETPKKVKKWSSDELAKIVDYLVKNPNIEQPTARIYYKAFLEQTPIQASWDLIRWKVRYLKTTYAKAEMWLQSTSNSNGSQGDAQMNSSAVTEKLNRMCPHYNKLKQIFGVKNESNMEYQNSDSESSISSASQTALPALKTEDDDDEEDECRENGSCTPAGNETPCIAGTENEHRRSPLTEPPVKKFKRAALLNTIKALTRRQEERCETQRLRILFEQEKFRYELEFNKEKFKVEQAFRAQEFELKRLEIEKNERLQIMEIEKNERIAKYEIDLKYRNYQPNQK